MRQIPHAVVLLVLAAALAGCASTMISNTPRSVTYKGVFADTIGETTDKAQAECNKYGRDAELVPDAQKDGIATFKCVDR